jgi:5'-methylthioadenosine phosphorylase
VPACAILGSAFADHDTLGLLQVVSVDTPAGPAVLHRDPETGGYVVFRHGRPHRYLPNQIPYRAIAWALHRVGCSALLVTSSVGVLDPSVPLYTPHLLDDLLMLDNRLPDGSACTVFNEERSWQGHLVVQDGLFDPQLRAWLRERAGLPERELTFLYVQGPRTKTPAENRYAASLGAHVNSMTVAPEVVLANELGIPTAGLVVGHKYSVAGGVTPDRDGIAASLERSREATLSTVRAFLADAPKVAFANELYCFGDDQDDETVG